MKYCYSIIHIIYCNGKNHIKGSSRTFVQFFSKHKNSSFTDEIYKCILPSLSFFSPQQLIWNKRWKLYPSVGMLFHCIFSIWHNFWNVHHFVMMIFTRYRLKKSLLRDWDSSIRFLNIRETWYKSNTFRNWYIFVNYLTPR